MPHIENISESFKLYLKKKKLIDHSSNPKNYGLFKAYDFISGEYNPSCGDSIIMCGLVQDDILQDIRFEAQGCMLSMAMASILTEYVKKMQLDVILKLDTEIIEQLLEIELGPNRLRCATLSIDALQGGIKKYQKKS